MKYEAFKQKIKEVNEQFHVVQTNGMTELHWIYGGFDVYEKASRKPQFNESKKSLTKPFRKFFSEDAANNQPLYHVIAEISETNEHVVQLNLDASRMPENMRRAVLPVVTEYVQTPLMERTNEVFNTNPVIKSADEMRKERRASKEPVVLDPIKGATNKDTNEKGDK